MGSGPGWGDYDYDSFEMDAKLLHSQNFLKGKKRDQQKDRLRKQP